MSKTLGRLIIHVRKLSPSDWAFMAKNAKDRSRPYWRQQREALRALPKANRVAITADLSSTKPSGLVGQLWTEEQWGRINANARVMAAPYHKRQAELARELAAKQQAGPPIKRLINHLRHNKRSLG